MQKMTPPIIFPYYSLDSNTCQACKTAGRDAATGAKRKALRELSHNIKRLKLSNEIKARRKDTKRTAWGCKLCDPSLCKDGNCFKEHLEAIRV